MSDYLFHADDVVFGVPGGFVDRTVSVLEWPSAGGRIALTLQREPRQDEAIDVVVRRNVKDMARAIKGFKERRVEATEAAATPAMRVTFEFRKDGAPFVQHQLYVAAEHALLVFGVTARAPDAAEAERVLDGVLESIRFRER